MGCGFFHVITIVCESTLATVNWTLKRVRKNLIEHQLIQEAESFPQLSASSTYKHIPPLPVILRALEA